MEHLAAQPGSQSAAVKVEPRGLEPLTFWLQTLQPRVL
jgi:hypothetical protein